MTSTTRLYGVLQDQVELNAHPPPPPPPHHHHHHHRHYHNNNLHSSLSDHPASNHLTSPLPVTTKQKLYVLGMQGVGAGLVNFLINFVLAYLMYRHLPHNTIAFTGNLTCVVSDVIVTAFLIPFLTSLIGSVLIRNDLRVGKLVTPIDPRHLSHPVFKRISTGQSWIEVIQRSLLFGFIGVVTFAPVTLFIIYACTGTSGMQAKWSYVAFKGYWGAIEAMLLSPVLAFIAIAQPLQPSPNNLDEDLQYTIANTDVEGEDQRADDDMVVVYKTQDPPAAAATATASDAIHAATHADATNTTTTATTITTWPASGFGHATLPTTTSTRSDGSVASYIVT